MTIKRVTVEHLAPQGQRGGPRADYEVVSVEVVKDRVLRVEFADGVEGEVRFEPTFFKGVFAHLIEPWMFADLGIMNGAVTWPDALDLAPDTMHDEIARNGEWVLH